MFSYQVTRRWLLLLVLSVSFGSVWGAKIDDKSGLKNLFLVDSLSKLGGGSNARAVTIGELTDIYKVICENNGKSLMDRVYDYEDMEFVDLLKSSINDSIPTEELAIYAGFFNERRLSGSVGENSLIKVSIDSYLKDHPQSVFMQRLYLYCANKNINNKPFMVALDNLLLGKGSYAGINLLMGQVIFVQEDYLKSIDYFTRVLKQVPTSAYTYNYRAVAYSRLDNSKAALADIDSAISLYPNYADAYNNKGFFYYTKDDYAPAQLGFRKAIEINGDFALPHLNLALVFLKLNRVDSALVELKIAHTLAPTNIGYANKIADVYYGINELDSAFFYFSVCLDIDATKPYYYAQRGNVLYDQGKTDLAAMDFKYAFSLNNTYVYALKRQADCALRDRDYKTATAFLKQAVEIDPNYHYGFNQMGTVYGLMSDFKNSNESYSMAIKLSPTTASYYCDRGNLFYNVDRYDLGLKDFNKAVELEPENKFYYAYRANNYFASKDLSLAVRDFGKALAIDSAYSYCFARLGDIQYAQRDSVGALTLYKIGVQVDSTSVYACKQLATLYGDLGKTDSALMVMQRIQSQYPQNVSLLIHSGLINQHAKRNGVAIDLFSKGIELAPGDASCLAYRGNAYLADKRTNEAIADFKRALEIDPNYFYPVPRLGDCYKIAEDYTTAVTWYDKALKNEPTNVWVLHGLSLCYTHLKLYDKSEDILKELIKIDKRDDSAYGNLGWLNYCIGNYKECIKLSHKAIELNDEADYAMFNIALATLRLGKFDEAKALYTNYVAWCVNRKSQVSKGAVADLQDLIDSNIMVEQSEYIIKNIIGSSVEP